MCFSAPSKPSPVPRCTTPRFGGTVHTTPQNSENMATAPFSEYVYPAASDSHLRDRFIGKRIEDLPTPAAILDERVLHRNCEFMLQATKVLGIGFRPHVKTHKVSVDAGSGNCWWAFNLQP